MSVPRLYTYFRSGAAQRIRNGLALKGLAYDSVPVHLVRNGGEHLLPAFKAINPQARVPVLELGDGMALAQSSAILEYGAIPRRVLRVRASLRPPSPRDSEKA